MANSPANPRKRAVAAAKAVPAQKRSAQKGSAVRVSRSQLIVDDEAPSENYALRLTEALEAISAAQTPQPLPVGEFNQGRSAGEGAVKADTQPSPEPSPRGRGSLQNWLKALDKLPPIRLPVGPAVPWRVGLPALVAVVAVMAFVSRPTARADAQGVRLPAQETYAVQQQAPLFAASQQAQAQTALAAQAQAGQPAQDQAANAAQTPEETERGTRNAERGTPLGVPEPAGLGFDVLDVGFKLIAVLALAYGSLMLLKRAGIGGGAAAGNGSGNLPGVRVVSSLALAPNRSVHVLKVPGGRTLLVGATPNAVNLIADLGEVTEAETPDAASFFDVLKGKLGTS